MSNIVKGSGIIYTTGVPNTIPNQGTDAEFAIDINGNQYAWNRTNTVWDNMGQAIEIATSSAAPIHTPSNFRPRFLVTPSRDFYFYSGSWGKIGSLPSGVFSSSGQIGPTGIYSGSGFIPTSSVATLDSFTGQEQYQVKLLFDAIGNYQGGWSDGFRQFGVESSDFDNSIFTFAGFQDDGDQVTYLIRSIDVSKDRDTLIRVASDLLELNSQYKINIHTNTLAFLFNNSTQTAIFEDNSTTPLGIQYGANYSNTLEDLSLVPKKYIDDKIISGSLLTRPELSGSKGSFTSHVSFSNTNRRILIYSLDISSLQVNLQPEIYEDGTELELMFVGTVVTSMTLNFPIGITTVPLTDVIGYTTVKYTFTRNSDGGVWLITNYVSIV